MRGCLGARRDEPSVNDADINSNKQHNKEIVKEAKETKHGLREDVERWNQVQDGEQTAEQHSKAEHPDETTEWEHLGDTMSQQCR